MSSKQDRQGARTAADIERRYNFGKSFAEVYNLVHDAQAGTEEAVKALDEKLNSEEIFNRLTSYGTKQGIYRGDDGDVYVNASYIKSGKLSAEYIDAENLTVNAANITGELVASKLNGENIVVADSTGADFGYIQKIGQSMAFIGAENVNVMAVNGWAKITAASGAEITLGALSDGTAAAACSCNFSAPNIEALEIRVGALERLFGLM